MSQGLPLHLPTSLVKASAGKQPPPCPKGRWLNSKAAPWDYRLSLEVPLPGICFINCICSAFFFFLLYCLPLQGDQKHEVLQRGPCAVALKGVLPVPVTLPSLSVGLLVGLPGESRAGEDRKGAWKAHTGPGSNAEVEKVEGKSREVQAWGRT